MQGIRGAAAAAKMGAVQLCCECCEACARLTAIMLALVLALAAAAIAAAETTLLLHTVHPTDPNAVCNDGSAP